MRTNPEKQFPSNQPNSMKNYLLPACALAALSTSAFSAVTHTFDPGTGVLTITGDGANDVINVQQSSTNVFYQANGPGNKGITPVGLVTAVVVNAGGGNDTVTAPTVTKPLTIIGGAGDDTLSGSGGADLIYGDDEPTQTFSPADPLTTVQASSSNGFGAPWVNIQPGSLFNQRQVARFNSATASVGSGAWTASLPRFVSGSPSASVLTYRQDNSYSTIDLNGIASMSFDINVTGSVTGYWYLMDPNGYILEVPAGFALSAGTHTVTFDLSTAAIDPGFDLSAVREMRIGISAASANSSVSVSNLRNGVIAPTLVTSDADPFTTTATPGDSRAVWTPISDSLFAQRRLQRFNQATTSLSGGFWDFTLQGTNATSYSFLHYRMDDLGGTTDLSGVSSMSVDFSNVTGSITFSWYFVDINGNNAYQPVNYSVTSAGTVTFNMSTAQSDDPGFDWSQVVSMHLDMSRTTGANTSASARVSNFDVTSGAAETGGNDMIDGKGGSDFLFGHGGDDTFCISNARDAFGDRISGGSGLDTVKNATSALVLTDFRTTSALDTRTVAGVEYFDGNGKEIRGRDASFDGVGNDVDLLDFYGITFVNVTRVDLRGGNDWYMGSEGSDDVRGGAGDDWIYGGSGNDLLNGGAGSDKLFGEAGDDVLDGSAQADELNGGAGADTFKFFIADTNGTLAIPSLNEDNVLDFEQGTDLLMANTSIYGQGALAVIAGTGPTATASASRIVFNAQADTTIYFPGTGTNAFRRVKIAGSFTLTGADFIQN